MRDYKVEAANRVAFIRDMLASAGAKGIVYGNSGGKDCALAGILCKMACENTVGLILPCTSKQNLGQDARDATTVAVAFGIETLRFDISELKLGLMDILSPTAKLNDQALTNIAPRLRMTTLYAVAAIRSSLVCGTGNRSEGYMGYFTKWGDGAYDFNPIGDLTVTEIYEFLRYLGAPEVIITKAPSAGLFEGQTDEGDMGVSYASIDAFITTGHAFSKHDEDIIKRYHRVSEHKRVLPPVYGK